MGLLLYICFCAKGCLLLGIDLIFRGCCFGIVSWSTTLSSYLTFVCGCMMAWLTNAFYHYPSPYFFVCAYSLYSMSVTFHFRAVSRWDIFSSVSSFLVGSLPNIMDTTPSNCSVYNYSNILLFTVNYSFTFISFCL